MKHYADKYHMTPEESLFLAKKKWDETLKPEGIAAMEVVSLGPL